MNQKNQSMQDIIQAPKQTQTKPFPSYDYLCTLIITGHWGVLCDMIGDPRQLISTLTLTHVFYMIGKPMRPNLTLTQTHVFYMIGEPRWPSSTLTLIHVFYMIGESLSDRVQP
jgi:hypothetical protein